MQTNRHVDADNRWRLPKTEQLAKRRYIAHRPCVRFDLTQDDPPAAFKPISSCNPSHLLKISLRTMLLPYPAWRAPSSAVLRITARDNRCYHYTIPVRYQDTRRLVIINSILDTT